MTDRASEAQELREREAEVKLDLIFIDEAHPIPEDVYRRIEEHLIKEGILIRVPAPWYTRLWRWVRGRK